MKNFDNVICDNCNRNYAKYKIKRNINGSLVDLFLCEDCYQALNGVEANYAQQYTQSEQTCPVCGTSRSKVADSLYLGCPNCYKEFRSDVLQNIVTIHRSRRHVGKKIKRNEVSTDKMFEISRLAKFLSDARESGSAADLDKLEKLLEEKLREING